MLSSPKCLALIIELAASGFLLVDLGLQLIDDAQQVQFHNVVFELVVLVLELALQSLNVQLGRQEAALGTVVLDVLE